jgi:hypothetical protein
MLLGNEATEIMRILVRIDVTMKKLLWMGSNKLSDQIIYHPRNKLL